MQTLKFKRFARRAVLDQLDRAELTAFIGEFRTEIDSSGLSFPPPAASDEVFRQHIGAWFRAPDLLPDSLNEALLLLDDLSSPKAFADLESSPNWANLARQIPPGATREDCVLRLWRKERAFLCRAHTLQRFGRLTAFQHAATRVTRAARPPFDAANKVAILNLTTELDAWFARNGRGDEATRVEVFPIAGEFWFTIRHGDLFTRAPKVERQRTEFLHFRPERDDVIVFDPLHDEIRVNARSPAERELYIREFGRHLRGDENYFAQRDTYSLEPLRERGEEALCAEGLPGIRHIALRTLEVALDNHSGERWTREADDLFRCGNGSVWGNSFMPENGRLSRAVFDVQLADAGKIHPVEIRLPDRLKIGRGCDVTAVHQWLRERKFRCDPTPISTTA
jgi:hypothetical protein